MPAAGPKPSASNSATGRHSGGVGPALSTESRMGTRRAMTDATRLQSRAVPALLASRSRRRASPLASTPNSFTSMSAAACIRSILSSWQSNHVSMSASLSRRGSVRSRSRADRAGAYRRGGRCGRQRRPLPQRIEQYSTTSVDRNLTAVKMKLRIISGRCFASRSGDGTTHDLRERFASPTTTPLWAANSWRPRSCRNPWPDRQ